MKATLNTNNIRFYTHQLRDEQVSKYVLYGLPKIDTNEIRNKLKEHDLQPTKIVEMTIRNKKNNDHCLYMIAFLKKDRVTLSDLNNVRVISYIRVNWDHYRNTRNGPTQCTNCLRFGHGANNCAMETRCLRCGENHKSKECPHIVNMNDDRPKIPIEKLCCALCKGNHTASYQKCPKRIEIINNRKKNNVNKPKQNGIKSFQHAPQLDNFNFPQLNNVNKNVNNKQAWINFNESNASSTPSDLNETVIEKQQLLNSEELFEIFLEMTNSLSSAKTRLEQIQMLSKIALKYSNPNLK
ncbi:hypothetical protein PVAND_003265 [Polypedilum vanderplanki]|uniref:Pre-C2HC domain-containing protein n=1 Tax=Polypedilum vanderplanki TaxID=319348 RepID=A0A9J6BV96_POLVA|nr:hypothetical protein PVAND_003265 [Polypedilum vanderplanki]